MMRSLGDRLNPVMVKELRQAVQGRYVPGVLTNDVIPSECEGSCRGCCRQSAQERKNGHGQIPRRAAPRNDVVCVAFVNTPNPPGRGRPPDGERKKTDSRAQPRTTS